MVKEFRRKLKDNGQSMRWFHRKYIEKQTGLTYGGFCHQLNGYATLTDDSKKGINKYMGK